MVRALVGITALSVVTSFKILKCECLSVSTELITEGKM